MSQIHQAVISTDLNQIIKLEFGHSLRDTTNPQGIKHLPTNRVRSNRHVRELADAIQKNGFITPITIFKNEPGSSTYVPDLTDGALYILDGSHRYEAAAIIKSEILFIFVQSQTVISSLKDVSNKLIGLNDKSKIWSIKDYIHHYATSSKAYSELVRLNDMFTHIQLKTIACYLFTGAVDNAKSNEITQVLRGGTFSIAVDLPKAEMVFKMISDIVCEIYLEAATKRDFNIALIKHILSNSEHFDAASMKILLSTSMTKIHKFCSQKAEERDEMLAKLFKLCKPKNRFEKTNPQKLETNANIKELSSANNYSEVA